MNDKIKIAKFMGHRVEYHPTIPPTPTGAVLIDGKLCEMNYDISWDSLMPVIQKINNMMPKINIPFDLQALRDGTHPSDKYMDVCTLPISVPISEAYTNVIKFIDWYNDQKK